MLAIGAAIAAAAQVRAQLVSGIEVVVHDSIVTRQEVDAMTAQAACRARSCSKRP